MSTNTLQLNSKLPSFNLLNVDGQMISDKSAENKKAVLIVFSCNHCPYVQAYEDRIKNIQQDFQESLTVFAINSNDDYKYPEDSYEEMQKRSEDKAFNYYYLRDHTQEVAKAFDATHTPEIFLFNNDRELVFHGKIDDNWKDERAVQTSYLRNAIEELLEDEPVSVPETFTIGCTIKWK